MGSFRELWQGCARTPIAYDNIPSIGTVCDARAHWAFRTSWTQNWLLALTHIWLRHMAHFDLVNRSTPAEFGKMLLRIMFNMIIIPCAHYSFMGLKYLYYIRRLRAWVYLYIEIIWISLRFVQGDSILLTLTPIRYECLSVEPVDTTILNRP